MPINLDVVIDTPEYSVDMKSGLESLQGISDATRCILETLLTERTPQRQNHKGAIRANLKQSFKGSYGHVFSLDIYDDELQRKFNRIGRIAFSEIVSYFISESVYEEPPQISQKAQSLIDNLGDTSEELVAQLRLSPLRKAHEVSRKFDYDVKLRLRKSAHEKTILAKFDRTTASKLKAKESEAKTDLVVGITRLNINTGNGRFIIKGEDETVAFGFGILYKEVTIEAKKLFSENLDFNNGIQKDNWKFLNVSASPIKTLDGKVVKYIIKGFYE